MRLCLVDVAVAGSARSASQWYSRWRGFAADSHRPSRPQVRSVGFSSDDSRVVCGDKANKVTVLDAASGEVLWEHELGGGVRALLTRVMPCAASVRFGWARCAAYVRLREVAGV